MEPNKTLWMLDIVRGKWGELIPIYAVDQTEAWIEAQRWAYFERRNRCTEQY